MPLYACILYTFIYVYNIIDASNVHVMVRASLFVFIITLVLMYDASVFIYCTRHE